MAHTATLLSDGTVLVAGGEDISRDMIATVESFDPATQTWTNVEPLPAPRSNHVAVRLEDGRVLVAGGGRSAPIGQPSAKEVTATAVLFDPATKHFSEAGPLGTARSHFGAIRLTTGEVLVAGGGAATSHQDCKGVPNCGPLADALSSTERFDPKSGRFRPVASMKHARYSFALTLLADGRVLATGGVTTEGGKAASTRSAEIYDPTADTVPSSRTRRTIMAQRSPREGFEREAFRGGRRASPPECHVARRSIS